MDGYQLIAALAWPIAAVILGLLLRKAIVDLIGKIKSLEAGGVKMTIGADAAKVVEDLPSPTPPPSVNRSADGERRNIPASPIMTTNYGLASSDATYSARFETMAAWDKLAAAVSSPPPDGLETSFALSYGRSLDLLPSLPYDIQKAVEELRSIRNDVAHGRRPLSLADALSYQGAVQNVLARIEQIKRGG